MTDFHAPRTPPRRRTLILGGLIAILALVGVVWLAWALLHGDTKSAAGDMGGPGGPGGPGGGGRRGPASTVAVATATATDLPIIIEALGTVKPAATVTVRPQVSGVITEVMFREGQTVQRGQPLVQIDPRPYQMALLQAQGNQTRDEAQLAAARLTLTRYQTLLAQDSIARQEVDTQAATVKQLEGTVMADRAAVGTARLNLGFARITAPVSGRVGLRVVDVGNYIGAGDTNGVAVITTLSPIDVEFTVPQDDVPRIAARQGRANVPVTALDRTRAQTLDRGSFSTLDNLVDTGTGTVKAKARFPNTGAALFPSQFVNVRMELDTIKGAIVVPATAVRQSSDGSFVWLLNSDQTVKKTSVKTGQATGVQVQVTQGLKAGDKVITEGGDRLRDGGKVQLPGAKPAGQGKGDGKARRQRQQRPE
ncbi:MdtA/MuxA family multidrug efflux RND transporter periplasmic adaptor subunit [Caulobacter segnis]|uniref:MdtA/MuxA family multidrug efflux RND transporter periplasmic adaptor subunit n=1 Tax=Caulobacter segnis TaxID=88688 RepID=UPI001CC13373|nr:MdtA/MuxA family multidrug efflux RND transporter periplasmic adaptor subunit [Caulobacter segnis]UAL11943.1 MdtA/MuxA family multidrug efflux RND transporter periplasmic adaptor subunit [Caulobacter segnis]